MTNLNREVVRGSGPVATVALWAAIAIPAIGAGVFVLALGRSFERESALFERARAIEASLLIERTAHQQDRVEWAQRELELVIEREAMLVARRAATSNAVSVAESRPRVETQRRRRTDRARQRGAEGRIEHSCGPNSGPLCGLGDR